jgi:hypothetical protein
MYYVLPRSTLPEGERELLRDLLSEGAYKFPSKHRAARLLRSFPALVQSKLEIVVAYRVYI